MGEDIANHTSDKALTSKLYKEFIQSNMKTHTHTHTHTHKQPD